MCKHVVYTTIVNFQINIVYRCQTKNITKKKKKQKRAVTFSESPKDPQIIFIIKPSTNCSPYGTCSSCIGGELATKHNILDASGHHQVNQFTQRLMAFDPFELYIFLLGHKL